MSTVAKNRTSGLVTLVLYLLFFTSFICSFRAVTSISLGLLLLAGLIQNRSDLRSFVLQKVREPVVITSGIFFLLQAIALLYTTDQQAGWDNLRLKSGLLFISFAFYGARLGWGLQQKLVFYYCVILAIASAYCLCMAGRHWTGTHDNTVFFYHALVSPFSQHAVYFSVFVLMALIFLLEAKRKKRVIVHPLIDNFLIIYFSVFLFLLSSKLVIAAYAVCMMYYLITFLEKNRTDRRITIALFILFIVTAGFVFARSNPVSNRFYEIWNGNMQLINQDTFDKADYFNGVQFRALQWRFVPDILTRTQSWWTGVSPGDAQLLLNNEYIARNMYTGDPATHTKGFLGYNTHNQFLETLLQTGIPGLIVFLLICLSLLRMVARKKNRATWLIVILLLVYSLTDSIFETQYGILIFTFFPVFAGYGYPKTTDR